MKSVQRSQAFLRRRKMMIVLPLLVIPFLTMAFYALGGGSGKESTVDMKQAGLNLNLPDAGSKNENMTDKLSFYDKAEKDSLKMEEWMRTDPYYKIKEDTIAPTINELEQIAQHSAGKYNQRLNTSPYENMGYDPEQKLMQKLSLLQNELNKQPENNNATETSNDTGNDTDFSSSINKLENLMQGMSNTSDGDPEIKQLGNTLDKILDIQHPQRVKERLKEKSLQYKEMVFAVNKQPTENLVGLLDTNHRKPQKAIGFYTTDNDNSTDYDANTIEAELPQSQLLVNGAVIKLRLTNDVYINGVLVPKNTLISGVANLNAERLNIEVTSIRHNNNLFTVKLEVYDLDGLPGIYIPGAITRDIAKQSGDDALQLLELTSVDPTFKAQAAAAGINTVKSLLSKKVKQVKVMVKAGYKVLLRDKNVQQ